MTVAVLFVTSATAKVVETKVVHFPGSGRVIVQSREVVGKFPEMVFISERSGKVLLRTLIMDKDGFYLGPQNIDPPPDLRFGVIYSDRKTAPVIMSVALFHGGSDDAFFLTVFGEIAGRIVRLNADSIFANIQGGFFFGRLNKELGFGLATWNFVWDMPAESHYEAHRYEMNIYRIRRGRLVKILRRVSIRKYEGPKSCRSLREIGIRATDQRRLIPKIRNDLDVSD
ncbi:MAG: hypothetical protein ABI878_04135 [Acidobacteriota bacterium]